MKKLFDETHGQEATIRNRTIWYMDEESDGELNRIFSAPDAYDCRTIPPGDCSPLVKKLQALIADDAQNASEPKPAVTNWIFYSSIVQGDALKDNVRFSIYVRLRGGRYACTIQMSDAIFATAFDATACIKRAVEACLNGGTHEQDAAVTPERERLLPFLSFRGNAEQAMRFYAATLPDTKIESLTRFAKGARGDEGKVLVGMLSVRGQRIQFLDIEAAADCPNFTWATSFLIVCEDDAEFDAVLNGLADGGIVLMQEESYMQYRKTAWVTDPFGVTWQPVLFS